MEKVTVVYLSDGRQYVKFISTLRALKRMTAPVEMAKLHKEMLIIQNTHVSNKHAKNPSTILFTREYSFK